MKTVADFLLERLSAWDIHRIYGYTGDSINPLMSALRKQEDSMDFTQVRHEEMAAFMAGAHAKFTGKVGVCCASAGPGAIHLLNGLYDAKLDNQSVVALIGQLPRTSMGTGYQQEVDLLNLFKDVAGDYVQVLNTPEQAKHLVDQAMRVAMTERTVTCLILPHDVQNMKAVETIPHKHHYTHSGISFSVPKLVPRAVDLEKAADILNRGEKVAILVGAGALDATDEIITTAHRLGAGVAKSLLGLAALPSDVPFVTGSIGLLGTLPSWEMMSQCDTLLMLGTDFPYTEFLPKEGQARGIQVDTRAKNLSKRYPMEANLIGDVKETLAALLPLLKQKEDTQWQEKIIHSVQNWQSILKERALLDTGELNPQRLFHEIFNRLPDDAIICTDTGTSTVWYAQYHQFRRGMMGAVSGRLASMGAGIPYAIAAKFAYPERPVIAFVGDGAMQMNGMNELLTIQKYWKEWESPNIIIVVLNNRDLNFVSWEMRVMDGNPKFEGSQDIPDFNYVDFAHNLGFKAYRIKDTEDIVTAWDAAVASNRPVIIEACTSPNVPPLPPHITLDQAAHFSKAILSGDPDAKEMIINSFWQMTKTLLHT